MTEAPEETISETSEDTYYEPRPRERKRRGRRGGKKRERGRNCHVIQEDKIA